MINKDTIHDIDLDDNSILQVYDIEIIQKYIQSSVDINLLENILLNVGYSINSTSLYKKYLNMLNKIQDENIRLEKIRNTYIHILQIPLHNINEMYSEFEEFELEINKITGKKIMSESFLIYQNTLQVYNLIKNRTRDYRFIIDTELKNMLKLSGDDHFKRMNFIFKNFLYYMYKTDEIYFLYTEYLIKYDREEAKNVVREGIKNTESIFLRIYYYYRFSDDEVLDEMRDFIDQIMINNNNVNNNNMNNNTLDHSQIFNMNNNTLDHSQIFNMNNNTLDHSQIFIMNYLNLVLKFKGLVSFRKEFIKFKLKNVINGTVYKNVADTEYKYSKNPEIVTKIYVSGIDILDSEYLKKELINFLLSIGDYNNCLLYVKKYNMGYNKLLDYEFRYGTEYFSMLSRNSDMYNMAKNNIRYGMNIELREDVSSFISSINYVKVKDNLLINCDINRLIEILKNI
jgi:cleavage stimulation factor subunit 3